MANENDDTPTLVDLPRPAGEDAYNSKGRLKKAIYEAEMERLQEELVKLQYWVHNQGLKVLVIFEGRDARPEKAA